MAGLQLKISDLGAVTGYTRFQMHGFLDEVFRTFKGKKRATQRTFSPQDLVVIAAACELEKLFAIKRSVLATVSGSLRQALIGPRNPNRDARLLITFSPPSVSYIDSDVFISQGVVLALGPVFAKVDEYLGVARASTETSQVVLPLPLGALADRRTSGRK
jgi:hypothetical protein